MPICLPMSPDSTQLFEGSVVADTVQWLERAVIGLNLCPFAKSVHVKKQIHYVVSKAEDAEGLAEDLRQELLALSQMSPEVRDTTLLIAPRCMEDFFDFNDFTAVADDLVGQLELDGVLQVAFFHPDFQFAGTSIDDVSNCSNRSPYPTLHLIREESIDRAVAAFPEADAIYERNIRLLEDMGMEGWRALDVGRHSPEATGAGALEAKEASR